MSSTAQLAVVSLILTLVPSAVLAGAIEKIGQNKLCVVNGNGLAVVDKFTLVDKVMTLDAVDLSKIDGAINDVKNGGHEYEERVEVLTLSATLQVFLLNANPSKYRLVDASTGAAVDGSVITISDFLGRKPNRYQMQCVNWAPKPKPTTPPEPGLLEKALNVMRVRQAPEDLKIADLSKAKPGTFSFTEDFRDNNAIQNSEVTLGLNLAPILGGHDDDIRDPGLFISGLWLYSRFKGAFNSRRDKRDINNLAFGTMIEALDLEFAGTRHAFDFESEFLTDDEANSSIANGKLIWWPTFKSEPGEFNPIGREMDLIPDLASLRLDLSGRTNFGYVFDDGGEPRLRSNEEFLRLGGRADATLGFSDFEMLSKFEIYSRFYYFYSVFGPLDDFYKLDTGVNFQFNQNFGLGFRYIRGTDEDKLDETNRFETSVTVKF